MSEDLVRELLQEHGEDYTAIATAIFKRGDKDLSIRFISVGVQKYAKAIRQKDRREIKLDDSFKKFVEFETVTKPTKKGPSIQLSEATIREGMRLAGIFVKWKVGGTSIRDMTKADLLAHAEKGERDMEGIRNNNNIYREVAKPMNNTETVGEHYHSKISEIERLYRETNKGKGKRKHKGDEAHP